MDLQTINDLDLVIKSEFKSRVCELEQQARDAESMDLHSYARELKHAAREIEVFSYRISTAFTSVFLDTLDQMTPAVERHAPVVKPSLPVVTPLSSVEVISPSQD